MATVNEPGRQTPVIAETDVLVVGGGPAGQSAAIAAARAGAEVMLLERFGYLGGLASGGMVLLLDDLCGGRARPRDHRSPRAHRRVRDAAEERLLPQRCRGTGPLGAVGLRRAIRQEA